MEEVVEEDLVEAEGAVSDCAKEVFGGIARTACSAW
jgi:hypothetical protein